MFFFTIKLKYILLLMAILSLPCLVQAVDEHNELWLEINATGPFSQQNKKIRYNLQPQLRFIDNRYKFHHAILNAGLGYQGSKNVSYWLGNSWRNSKNSEGTWIKEYRVWQQLSWNILSSLNLSSRTRLEERKRHEEHQMAIRLRQRLTLSIK